MTGQDQILATIKQAVDDAVNRTVPTAVQVSIPIYVNGKIDKLTVKLEEYMNEQGKLNQARFELLTKMDNEQQVLRTNQTWLMKFMIAIMFGIGGMFVTFTTTLATRGL